MKKPFTLDAALLSIQGNSRSLDNRLAKLETWEPGSVGMQVAYSGALAYVSGASITLPYNVVYYDTHDAFDATNYTFVAPHAGRYLAIMQGYQTGGAGVLTANMHIDGTPTYLAQIKEYQALGYWNLSMIFDLEADEELITTFDATVNATIVGSGTITSFSVEQVT